MPGTIRVVLGLVITMSAVGGIDSASDTQLWLLATIAAVGLAAMYSGVKAMQV
jgi:hypothetical protein